MEIHFDYEIMQDYEDLPYQVKYMGYEGPAISPRLGLGSVVGHGARTYSDLIDFVIKDLGGVSENIKVVFSDNINDKIGEDLKKLTELAFRLLVEKNISEDKMYQIDLIVRNRSIG